VTLRAWVALGAALLPALAAAAPGPVARPSDPEACAPCHARQVEEWRASPHAHAAASEGFFASLRRWGAPAASVADRCLACHVPAASDRVAAAEGLLAGRHGAGVTCEACHGGTVAAHPTRFRPGVSAAAPAEACAACHRWAPGGVACSTVYDGWRASPAAAAGSTCETCHMPEGSHRFAGSRSAEMLARAATLRVRAESSPEGPVALVEVRNLAGHRLPDG
jgi:hypothetical protein